MCFAKIVSTDKKVTDAVRVGLSGTIDGWDL